MSVRIGILSFAHMHAGSYASAARASHVAELVGIADADPERGGRMAERFSSKLYESDEALLDQKLDGVVVCSENVNHRPLVEKAVAAGVKYIACEKPLATTVADARAMVDLCNANGVKLVMAFPCRFSEAYRRLRQQVQAGAIGDVLAIRGTNHGQMPGGWFIDKALSGGGAVIDHTVHVADLNHWLLGKKAATVYAEIGNGFYHKDWDDTGFLTITYEGGVFATLDTSWSRLKSYPTWGDVTLQVVGTGGVIDLDMFAQNIVHYSNDTGRISWSNWGSSADAGLVNDFIRLCAGEEAPELATGEDGLEATAVAMAAYKSAEVGEPVTVVR